MNYIDFGDIAKFCVTRFKESLNPEYQKYIETLYVSISSDNEVICSTTPHCLGNAEKCLLIHVKSQLEFTNWYRWYTVEYINEEGAVTDGHLDGGFRLSSTWRGNYRNMVLNLLYDKNPPVQIYSCPEPFFDKMQKVWDLYRKVKKIKSEAELEFISEIIYQDEKIIELEKNIADLKFTNRLLEKQKNQYKDLLKEIKELVMNRQ